MPTIPNPCDFPPGAGPAGPPGPPGPAAPTYSAENQTLITLRVGRVVAAWPGGTGVWLADATAPNAAAVGIAISEALPGFNVDVQTKGPLVLLDWTECVGAANLTQSASYFLDPANPGMLTATPPGGAGNRSQRVGVALTPSILDLDPLPPILL